jgi:hypothetical protein
MHVEPRRDDSSGAPSTPAAEDERVDRTAGRALLLGWLALAALPCLGYLAAELYMLDGRIGLPLDDGWIHLQFARNLAAGSGLAYNPGERVAGSTAPLWTALLSLGFLLPSAAIAWAKALGIACHLLAVVGTWRLARELDVAPALATLAAGLAATTSALVWSALSGMEVPLFTALSLWGLVLHARERRDSRRAPLSLAVLGLAALARPEGLLIVAAAVVDRAIVLDRAGERLRAIAPSWRRLLLGLALAALAVVPVLLVYQAIAGSPLPTTFDTKAGYSRPGLPRVRYLFEVAGVLAAAQPVATLLAPAGVLALLSRLGGPRDRGLLPALWAAGLPLAYGVLSGSGRGILGNFGRYFFPLLPVVIVLAIVGAETLLGELPRRVAVRGREVRWPVGLVALLVLPGLGSLIAGAGRYAHNVRDIEDGDVRLARILATRLPAEATLAVDDIGALKFFLPNRVVDLAGIVTPEVHAYARRAAAETGSYCPGVLEFVRAARPDYLAIFPRHHACMSDEEFPPLLQLEVPDNITLGEGTIVVHSAPWTRYPLRPPPAAR